MPDQAKAELIRKSKIGSELTEEQCKVLSDLIEVQDHADGESRMVRRVYFKSLIPQYSVNVFNGYRVVRAEKNPVHAFY